MERNKKKREYDEFIDKSSGKRYKLFYISASREENGAHVVKNPAYNGEPEYHLFKADEIEPIYPKTYSRKRGMEYVECTIKETGVKYSLARIDRDGTHYGRNPAYNGEPFLLLIDAKDVEPIYPEKVTPTFFKQQSQRQDQWYPDREWPD